ncbi:mCG16251, isoform CRA_a [Mus musculus]|nr:mCG16251, isoform CRA_a [Mus musculus]EDL30113.1 mCG16251, isoform CRA_a [Mus musculus]
MAPCTSTQRCPPPIFPAHQLRPPLRMIREIPSLPGRDRIFPSGPRKHGLWPHAQ